MIIEKNEAHQKLSKLQQTKHLPEFALSPQGFLLIKQGHVLDCSEYRLYSSGQYYRREGFTFESSAVVPECGLFLCTQGNGKFLAPREDGMYEFSTTKKSLSEDFSLIIYFRAINRLVLLIADGAFAPEAFMITLPDSPGNERFCLAVMRKALESRNLEAATKLTADQEDDEDGQEA